MDPVVCSLTSAFDRRLKQLGGVDLLVFNPPYVPTYTEEASNAQGDRDIQGSWAGGSLGMEITNRVLDSLGVSILHIRVFLYQQTYLDMQDYLNHHRTILSCRCKGQRRPRNTTTYGRLTQLKK